MPFFVCEQQFKKRFCVLEEQPDSTNYKLVMYKDRTKSVVKGNIGLFPDCARVARVSGF